MLGGLMGSNILLIPEGGIFPLSESDTNSNYMNRQFSFKLQIASKLPITWEHPYVGGDPISDEVMLVEPYLSNPGKLEGSGSFCLQHKR